MHSTVHGLLQLEKSWLNHWRARLLSHGLWMGQGRDKAEFETNHHQELVGWEKTVMKFKA